MVYDAYGKEIKVGDRILYPTSAGAGSGQNREYTVECIFEYSDYQGNQVWNEEAQKYKKVWAEKIIGQLTARPSWLASDWEDHSYRLVQLKRSDRAIVITGINLKQRYAEPQVVTTDA